MTLYVPFLEVLSWDEISDLVIAFNCVPDVMSVGFAPHGYWGTNPRHSKEPVEAC